MRTHPDSDSDSSEELAALRAEPWMLDLLRLNPSYVFWGPHEDYMWKTGEGWDSRLIFETWCAFGPWPLNELNEIANFYFEVSRDSRKCDACGETGLNPATKQIGDDFYDFAHTGRRWCDRITQDEVDALIAHGRLWDFWRRFEPGKGWVDIEPRPVVTAEQVNAKQSGLTAHDAINRCILVETRAKRLGVYGLCEECGGEGYVYTADKARVGLVLWMLHPRKGCSRGVEVKSLSQGDLPAAFRFLRAAAERNAARFAAIPAS